MKDASHRHTYLNSKSLVGGAVCGAFETFRTGALLEEACHCLQALRVHALLHCRLLPLLLKPVSTQFLWTHLPLEP